MSRNKARIDYKALHTSGKKVQIQSEVSLTAQFSNLSINEMTSEEDNIIEIQLLVEEVTDTIDETPFASATSVELDASIEKLEKLRADLRRRCLKSKLSDDNQALRSAKQSLSTIKEFIISAKDCKSKLNLMRTSETATSNQRSMAFIIEDVQQNLAEIEEIITQNIEEVDDKKLSELRTEKISNRMEKISVKYEKLLQLPITDGDTLYSIKNIGDKYVKLNSVKMKFNMAVQKEYLKRELDKDQSTKHINIKIDKYIGYESSLDFYTFKSNFEKLHLKTTPTRFLPDLLKNNYLGEPAISLVRNLDSIDDIWARLKEAYGDSKTMLTKKLQILAKTDLESRSRSRDPEKLVFALSKFINVIREIIQLAKKHGIEDNLYFGDSLPKIYHQLGDKRLTRFLSSIADDKPSEKETWERLLTFLEKEEKLNQQKLLIQSHSKEKKDPPPGHQNQKSNQSSRKSFHGNSNQFSNQNCQLCGEASSSTEHMLSYGPGGTKIIQYYTCKNFVDKTPSARLSMVNKKGFCIQCLLPGADASEGKHSDGKCQRDYVCPHPSHQKYSVKKHVLLCEEHKQNQENQDVLSKFKSRCMRNSNLPEFSKEIKLSFHSSYKSETPSSKDSINNKGVYLLQTITVNGNRLNIFFDNGCSDFILSTNAVTLLGTCATKYSSEPICLGGVGNSLTTSSGSYNVTLPLHNGKKVTLSGICLDRITSNFPTYPLTDVERDIINDHRSSGRTNTLPKLPSTVGGEVHLMIGVKYLRYHPKLVHQLQSGLSIFESVFRSSDGGRGVVGGPHKVFSDIQNSFYSQSNSFAYLVNKETDSINDLSLLGYQENQIHYQLDEPKAHISHQQRLFEQAESTGCEVTYRCPTCRTCKECKHFDEYQSISLKEEVEQSLINSSVTINLQDSTTTATLPFISSPSRLAPNKDKAMKVYKQQLRKLNLPANAKDKADIIDSQNKLQKLGYVEYVSNLPPDTQQLLSNHSIQNFIPWRAVWKGNSVSTPCRVVFDASQPTSSGYSLNDLLAKGRNNLNKLQEIVVRWSMYRIGIHTDIKKMYNTIKLNESDWCYQRYIWEENLDPSKIPDEKVIKTLIYGVRSSGNQAEYGLRQVAKLSAQEYPRVNEVVQEDIYVDDCITGEQSTEPADDLADNLEIVINKGGFELKGVSISGQVPPEKLTDDGETIHIAGMRWFPKDDLLALNVSELNFAKKCRGKKPSSTANVIPSKLTRRHCASKVAEIFDLTGKVTPIVAAMKMDLQELVYRNLDWDDIIPDEIRPIWESHFQMMQEINNLRFKRAVIPIDAINLDVETIDFGDASQSMVCSCIYVRFKRKSGSYSCQLVLSRSRVVPKGMSLPRAELYAALLNTYTGEVVRRSFKHYHKIAFKLTDSQIALFWITNDQKPLKQWVRNRVIEIQRFTSPTQWFYIQSNENLADIGTRRGTTLKDVDQNSVWMNGHPWMIQDHTEFPILKPNQIKFEDTTTEVECHTVKVHDDVKNYYAFSDYLIDPNRFSFGKIIRIIAYVIRFISIIKRRIRSQPSKSTSRNLTNDEIKQSENYFYRIATKEIYQFIPQHQFNKITMEKDGILHYSGRILPSDEVTIVGKFTSAMKDLSRDTFCVPVLAKNSPIAYSVALNIHWNHPVCKHSGVETTMRYLLKNVFIIDGRSLIKSIRKSCQRCRYLLKKSLEVVMGPISSSNITIAPPFYASQLDLSGPYNSYSPSHRRTTVKIWLIVFCCCATSATSIKVMDNYSTDAFILSFTRFACDHGYPKKLYCDGGSQLIKGCADMKLDFQDLQSKLHRSKDVDFAICPVGGHNMNGRVERKVQEINKSIEKNVNNERLSLMQWETLSAVIANTINDLPIGLGSKSDVENMDLVTPNRLLLGRNNDRSPVGDMILSNNPSKLMKENEKIYNAWFESWLLNHVPQLMNQSKWFKNEYQFQIGDVVLFKKHDSTISKTYQYGIISKVEYSKDNVGRKVMVRYCNANENTSRETFRSVRELVLIRSVDELDLLEELYEKCHGQ